MTEAPGHASARVSERRPISPIWIVPILTVVIGIWMVVYSLMNQGPEIVIRFPTAEGIEPGKTKIKTRDVEVGQVEEVRLGEDLKSVLVSARLDPDAADLLRKDTQFWVVRARLGAQGISGIATLLSGGYIQLAPGGSPILVDEFQGLEEPPVTPAGTPGLQFFLFGEEAGSVSPGDPILYKGFQVGRIESAKFDPESLQMRYSGFIDETYAGLISTATRFWNASGVSLRTTASGIEFEADSVLSVLLGGVTFGLPEGLDPGEPVDNGTIFELYPDFATVNAKPHTASIEYVVQLEQSIRGLGPGAAVEYRGLKVGRVDEIMTQQFANDIQLADQSIPVRIRLEPARLDLPDSEVGNATLRDVIDNAVTAGLRASLVTGNILTGNKYLALDFYPRATKDRVGKYAGRPTIPTIAAGLEGLEHQVVELLDKINRLPLRQLTLTATDAVRDIEGFLENESLQRLPNSLEETLGEIRTTLRTVSTDSQLQSGLMGTLEELDQTLVEMQELIRTLNDQPSSILFDRAPANDPVPPSGRDPVPPGGTP